MLSEVTTSISFVIKNQDGYIQVMIEKQNQRNLLMVEAMHKVKKEYTREISKDEWETLTKELFNELDIQDWKEKYCGVNTEDHKHWSLRIELTDKRELNYQGNSLPPYWSELKKLFTRYMNEFSVNYTSTKDAIEWIM